MDLWVGLENLELESSTDDDESLSEVAGDCGDSDEDSEYYECTEYADFEDNNVSGAGKDGGKEDEEAEVNAELGKISSQVLDS